MEISRVTRRWRKGTEKKKKKKKTVRDSLIDHPERIVARSLLSCIRKDDDKLHGENKMERLNRLLLTRPCAR